MRWGEFAPLIPVLRECTCAFPSEGAQYSERGHDLPVIIQQVRAEGRWPPLAANLGWEGAVGLLANFHPWSLPWYQTSAESGSRGE